MPSLPTVSTERCNKLRRGINLESATIVTVPDSGPG
jgi:hypothetical protein